MPDTWLKSIEDEFEQRFEIEGVRAELSKIIPLQANLKITIPNEPTPEMNALARAIEAEHAEIDQIIWVKVVRTGTDSRLRSFWSAVSQRLAS